MAVGASQTFTPSGSTQYYVRGEGGCITGGGTCNNVSVTVNPLTNFFGTVTTNTSSPTPVAGYVVLYEYLPTLTKFDSITYQNLDASGNYNFSLLPPKNYIILAVPTLTTLQTTYAPSEVSWKTATVVSHGCSANTNQNVNVIPLTNLGGGPGVFQGTIVEGLGYGQKGSQALVPGNPIKGLVVKGGRNPGGDIMTQSRTNSAGQYTLDNFPISATNESYFILVDIPGLDTNGTYHKVITTSVTQYNNMDFNVDSIKVNPYTFVGINEHKVTNITAKVFPNPANDNVYIEMESEPGTQISVELLDITGKMVKPMLPKATTGISKYTLVCPVREIDAGVYILRIKTGARELNSRLVIAPGN